MKRQKREKWLLVATPISLIVFFLFTIFFPPGSNVNFLNTQLPTNTVFFVLLFLTAGFIFSYISRSFKQGILLSIFVTALGILKFNHLLSVFFFLLLLALLAAAEYLLK